MLRTRALVLAVLVAGCTSTVGGGEPCRLNSDCTAPLVCAAGLCSQQCREDRDCPFPLVCAPGPTPACVPRDVDGGATGVDSGRTEAGTDVDLGSAIDGGTDVDLGGALDAGTDLDSGADAGSALDAGTDVDARVAMDAGATMDSGVDVDAGPPRDAGPPIDASRPYDAAACVGAPAGTIARVQGGLSFYTPATEVVIHLTDPTCPGTTLVMGIATTGRTVYPPPGFVELAHAITTGCNIFFFAYVANPGGLWIFDVSETGGDGLAVTFSEWAGVAASSLGIGGSGPSDVTTAIAGIAAAGDRLALSLYCEPTMTDAIFTSSATWDRETSNRYTMDPFHFTEDRIIGPIPATLTEDPTSSVAAPWSWVLASFSPL